MQIQMPTVGMIKPLNPIKTALALSVIGVTCLCLVAVFLISPMYIRFMVNTSEQHAISHARFLTSVFIDGPISDIPEGVVSPENEKLIRKYMRDLDLFKLRIFSSTGKIIYSSENSETGQIDSNPSFFSKVAKGYPYTKLVEKTLPTREGDPLQIDVVESYIPIIKDNIFVGALEIYLDVSRQKAKLEQIARSIYRIILPVSLVLLILIIFVSLKADSNYQKLKQTESDLSRSYEKVERQVSERTIALRLSNERLQTEINDRKQYEKQMLLSQSVFENIIEGIMITDPSGRIQRINRAFTQITGFSSEEAIGRTPGILSSGKHDKRFYDIMWKTLNESGTWKGEIWNRRKNGEVFPVWLSITAIMDQQDRPIYYVGLFHDISDLKKNEQLLKYQANFDALTGLPNRQLFNDRLKMAIEQAERKKLPLGVLFLDLDDFKNINDSLGHYYGDLLLKKVADRLSFCCRKQDTVARLGGDEFLIICPFLRTNEPAAASLAQRILGTFMDPVMLEDKEVYVRMSIGITLFPGDGNDIDTLVKNADVAMYKAKEQGKNRFSFYTKKLNKTVLRRIRLSDDLRNARERNEFMVYYQPKTDIQSGLISGMEALVRWNRNHSEIVSPSEFIPIAEDSGVIYSLGEWVMEEACTAIKKFSSICRRDLKVAVNLSVKQLTQENLAQKIKEILERTGLSPQLLTLEITENMVIKDIDSTIIILNQLADLGTHISIDDFGTGYSSLSYLKKMPLSELKVDKTFIDDTPDDPEACAIVNTILSLSKHLNLTTVAEGVETKQQLDFLRENECREIQGYYICKPLDHSAMELFLKNQT